MKVINGIELLQMIDDKKITENNHISLINLAGGSLPLKWQYGMLYFLQDNDGRELDMFDLMTYTFEIIEEEKEIEELNIHNLWLTESQQKEMVLKINEIIRELNKIKKEGK